MTNFHQDIPSAGAEFAHRYVMVNGARLHCAIAGDGAPVLLVPGWPQTWFTWRHVMRALTGQGYMAIAVDPPGTGDSDRPAAGYDTGAVAATLHQLMRQLGHARYQVVGHDIGMWVAYALASDFPDAVSRLALTEAVIPAWRPSPRSSRRRTRTSSCGISCSTGCPTCRKR